jgi:hypothetical protein
VKKEKNGRESLRRLKPTVGCNASERSIRNQWGRGVKYSTLPRVEVNIGVQLNLFSPSGHSWNVLELNLLLIFDIDWRKTLMEVVLFFVSVGFFSLLVSSAQDTHPFHMLDSYTQRLDVIKWRPKL